MSPLPSPVTIPDTELRMLASSVVDQEFTVFVALPHTYTKDSQAYPVVYLLDANLFFGIVTETVRLFTHIHEIPEVIVVGIGYPVRTATETLGLRTRDFTPTEVDGTWYEAFKSHYDDPPEYAGSGGAAPFLRFLRDELMPFVDTGYRTKPGESALMGDSLGGLFALYALFSQPDSFRRYIIGSPSVWWDDEAILALAKDFAARTKDVSATVLLSVGGNEREAMIAGMYRVAHMLRSQEYKSMELSTRFHEGETHLSTIPGFISWGLRTAFGQ